MINYDNINTRFTSILLSPKTKKIAVIILLAGMLLCFLALLPPVQNILFSFVDANTSVTGLRASGTFSSRLMSLLSLPFFGLVVLIFIFCCLFSKPISLFFEDEINKKTIIIALAGLLVLLVIFTSVFSYFYGSQWLNSDHSSEMILAKLLAEENSLVSSNWRYSTEIRLIYQTIFSMPLFKFFGNIENWALIRSLTIFFNNLLLILSYLYMAKQMNTGIKWRLISSLFLLMPISFVYWDITIFGGYYITFITQIFFSVGLFLYISKNDRFTKRMLVYIILFALLSFSLGLQGIRAVFCVHIPLLISCVYIYFKTSDKKIFPLFLGCFGFLICCAGFAGNYLLHFKYSFHSFDATGIENLFQNFLIKTGQSLVSIAEFFGLNTGISLLSAQGLFSLAAIAGTIILFTAVISSVRKINKQTVIYNNENYFINLFFIISAVFNIFTFIIVTQSITVRYFIPFMVLYVPVLSSFFSHTEKSFSYLKRTAVIAGIILFIFGQSCLNFHNISGYNVNSIRKGYISYLLENKLKYGFATFWNSNVTTELTDGKIEIAGLEPNGLNPASSDPFRIQGWLNHVKYYNHSYYQDESFLLLSRSEWEDAFKSSRAFTLNNPDYEDEYFIILRYPSAEIIYFEVLDN